MACPTMSTNFYIYYKLEPDQRSEIEPLIHTLLSRMACRTGVAGRLLKKADSRDTWMEVYEGIKDRRAFEHALNELCDRYDLAMLLDRHTEVFENLYQIETANCGTNGEVCQKSSG